VPTRRAQEIADDELLELAPKSGGCGASGSVASGITSEVTRLV
jgi:hypothetical protein